MLIVITDPGFRKEEAEELHRLFGEGMETLHLRKPNAAEHEYETLLRAISPEYKKRVMLHQHHSLASKYNVKGIHLKEEYRSGLTISELRQFRKDLRRKGMLFSSSFHSLEKMAEFEGIFDYVFLSPIFESISKPHYLHTDLHISDFSIETTKMKVIALGGIEPAKVLSAKQMGFHGIAVLGFIWQNSFPVMQQFESVRDSYLHHFKQTLIP